MSQAEASVTLKVISGLGAGAPAAAGCAQPGAHSGGHHADLQLDPRTFSRALDCVHCGLCLPACPTYTQNGLEADSPRGRIYLMKGLATGAVRATDSVLHHLDLCLDCQACETACPSGVKYHELIEETRARFTPHRKFKLSERLMRWIFLNLFTAPGLLKVTLLPARLLQKIGLWQPLTHLTGGLLPFEFRKMQQMLPPKGPLWEKNLAEYYPPTAHTKPDGSPRARVVFFPGCVGEVLFQEVNRKAIRVLQHLGCEVRVPRSQACCGAIHHHAGDDEGARKLARRNIDLLFPIDGKPLPCDYIVNTISGCGAALKDYDHLLRDDPVFAERAKGYTRLARDITEVVMALQPPKPPHRVERTVTFHHACHLVHAQKVSQPPLKMLQMIDGLTVKPLMEADMCCGAAGTYNLTQPEMATQLGERKIGHIERTGAGTCVTGNVGCAMQIESEANRLGVHLTTEHPIELLHEAYFGRDAKS